MPNLRIFGSAIHDTALVMIVTSSLSSIFYYVTRGYIERNEANMSLLFGLVCSGIYWYTQYKIKK
jgi:hypothetical protein